MTLKSNGGSFRLSPTLLSLNLTFPPHFGTPDPHSIYRFSTPDQEHSTTRLLKTTTTTTTTTKNIYNPVNCDRESIGGEPLRVQKAFL
ncbi:hypothetical protein CRUP_034258 [Coryphaenoides rupestris]|nr:hypothetical protein CRUP_034258 [Coryphaenoides rupestris]